MAEKRRKLEDILAEVDSDWCKDEKEFVAELCNDAAKKIKKLKKQLKKLEHGSCMKTKLYRLKMNDRLDGEFITVYFRGDISKYLKAYRKGQSKPEDDRKLLTEYFSKNVEDADSYSLEALLALKLDIIHGSLFYRKEPITVPRNWAHSMRTTMIVEEL